MERHTKTPPRLAFATYSADGAGVPSPRAATHACNDCTLIDAQFPSAVEYYNYAAMGLSLGATTVPVSIAAGSSGFYGYDCGNVVTDCLATHSTTVTHYEYDARGDAIMPTGRAKDDSKPSASHRHPNHEALHYDYAQRYLHTELGRWMSRDPIEESGGHNLYVHVFNAPTLLVDPVGDSVYDIPVKKEFDVPATPEKCAKIRAIIAIGSTLDPVDSRLWNAWLSGAGGAVVNFDEFDTGRVRSDMESHLDRITQSSGRGYGSGLPCGSSGVAASGSITRDPSSSHRMISAWRYTFRYLVIVEKTCDPCCELSAKVQWRHAAFDTTDFNDGLDPNGIPYYFEGGGFRIYDRLVNACNQSYNWGAKDFDISAEEEGDKVYFWPCDN